MKAYDIWIGGTKIATGTVTDAGGTKSNPAELQIVAYLDTTNSALTDLAHQVMNLGQNGTVNIKTQPRGGSPRPPATIYYTCLLTSLDFPSITPGSTDPLTLTATFQPSSKRTVVSRPKNKGRKAPGRSPSPRPVRPPPRPPSR